MIRRAELETAGSSRQFRSALGLEPAEESDRFAGVADDSWQHDLAEPKSHGPRRWKAAGAWLRCALAVVVCSAITVAPWIWQQFVWCEWLGLAGILLLAQRLRGWRRWLALGSWSLLSIVAAFHWSPQVLAYTMNSSYALGVVVFVPLAIWDAARIAIPLGLAVSWTRRPQHIWITAAVLLALSESFVPSVFPFRMGYTQIAWPWLVQASDVFGPEWPTIVLMAIVGVILALVPAARQAFAARNWLLIPERLLTSPAVWLCAVNLTYSAWAMVYWKSEVADAPTIRVALVQVDPNFVESTSQSRQLTRRVARQVDLVCWPESSGGTYDVSLKQLTDDKEVFARSRDPERGVRPWPTPSCPLLLGGKTYAGDRERPTSVWQTAMLIDADQKIAARYQKRYLMPFGEYVPGSGWVPGIDDLFSMEEEISAGKEATIMPSVGGSRIGAMLCYEDMVPGAARSMTADGANLLVSLINGAAFTNPLTLAQHRLLAQLRAVECRRCFLRCSATGETCAISPLGVIEDRLPMQTRDALCVTAPLLEARSAYSCIGDILPLACGLVVVGWLATPLWRKRRASLLG